MGRAAAFECAREAAALSQEKGGSEVIQKYRPHYSFFSGGKPCSCARRLPSALDHRGGTSHLSCPSPRS
jgi:hypothetical protein